MLCIPLSSHHRELVGAHKNTKGGKEKVQHGADISWFLSAPAPHTHFFSWTATESLPTKEARFKRNLQSPSDMPAAHGFFYAVLPLQYWRTVSMAHFLSDAHLIRADPAILFSTGHQPCQRYTSWRLSTRKRAEQAKWNLESATQEGILHIPDFLFYTPCSHKPHTRNKTVYIKSLGQDRALLTL